MHRLDFSLRIPAAAAAICALGFATPSVATPSFAGRQSPGAIPGERVDLSPDATAHFRCEKRPFDLSKGLFCYGPAAIRSAYGVQSLLDHGYTGTGQTIVILDAFGSPVAQQDLRLFDKVFGLPDPPSFTVVTMPGTPAFDPTDPNMVGWSAEIALDVQWSHAMAPGAKIVLVAAASNSDQDLIDGLNYAIDHHLGNVVSMSFGESESALGTPDGLDIVDAWQAAFARARKSHITLFVSAGDQGSTNVFDNAGDVLPFQNVSFPASSPLVTSVGGTNLLFGIGASADPNGAYKSESVWNDGFGAGGGGMSVLFPEADWQRENLPKSVNRTLHGHRGVPDVAYNAGVVGGVLAVWSIGYPNGFFIFGGTSAGSPQWSGIISDVNQAVGRPAGFINPRLYRLGAGGSLTSLFHDITTGDNGFLGVPGYSAGTGYDLATGWGTPDFGTLGSLLSNPDDDDNAG